MTTTNCPLPPFVAFMVRIPHANRVQLQTVIESYCGEKAKYLLAAEGITEEQQHFHGIIMCTRHDYDKIQRHFREKWKLCGQATKGKTRQYGRIRNIRDRNKVLTYTVKDRNVYTSETWDINLNPYIEASFKKIKNNGSQKDLREKQLKDYLISNSVKQLHKISTKYVKLMDDDEFSSYQEICEQICRIYQKYNFDFPTLKTINKLLVRYGIMNIKEAIDDHLSRWFRERDAHQFQHSCTIQEQIQKHLGAIESYLISHPYV